MNLRALLARFRRPVVERVSTVASTLSEDVPINRCAGCGRTAWVFAHNDRGDPPYRVACATRLQTRLKEECWWGPARLKRLDAIIAWNVVGDAYRANMEEIDRLAVKGKHYDEFVKCMAPGAR